MALRSVQVEPESAVELTTILAASADAHCRAALATNTRISVAVRIISAPSVE
jgi:hypothetical protein